MILVTGVGGYTDANFALDRIADTGKQVVANSESRVGTVDILAGDICPHDFLHNVREL